jgi:hypothetical protein
MKREQKFITMLSLILVLSGLSSVAAADVGMEADGPQNQQTHQSNAPPVKFALSLAQMDEVHAGLPFGTSIVPALKAWGCSQGVKSWC